MFLHELFLPFCFQISNMYNVYIYVKYIYTHMWLYTICDFYANTPGKSRRYTFWKISREIISIIFPLQLKSDQDLNTKFGKNCHMLCFDRLFLFQNQILRCKTSQLYNPFNVERYNKVSVYRFTFISFSPCFGETTRHYVNYNSHHLYK